MLAFYFPSRQVLPSLFPGEEEEIKPHEPLALPQELSSPCQGLVPTPPALGALAGGSLALFVVSAIPGMVCTLTALPLRSGSLVASKSLREALSVYYSKQVPEPHRE